MGHGPCTFKKRDLKIALEATREAGLKVTGVKIDKAGNIDIITGESTPVINDLDRELAEFENDKGPAERLARTS
jgi:hypothetical protein